MADLGRCETTELRRRLLTHLQVRAVPELITQEISTLFAPYS
jgi:hypothetical protein